MMIRALRKVSCSNVVSTRVASASKEFLTNSNTAMKSFVISSLPMMVLRAELTRNTGADLGILEDLHQNFPRQLGKQRWNGVTDLCVARDFPCAPVSARGVPAPVFKIIGK